MEIPKSSGIYLIKNIVNEKSYVGQSQDMNRRIKAHIRDLNRNAHCNPHLQKAWGKYGKDAFVFSVLEECPIELLNEREMYYIAKTDSFSSGYNMNMGGGSSLGYRHTDETKRKLRERHADMSGENNPMYGHSVHEFMTEEAIALWKFHISQSMMGEKNHFYGKKHTAESCAKISKSKTGKFKGEMNPMYGRSHTAETRIKIKEALKDFYDNNRGANNSNASSVVCLNTLEVFGCIADACLKYGVSSPLVSSCCSGRIHSAGVLNGERLVWAYYDNYNQMTDDEIKNTVSFAQHSNTGSNNKFSKKVICLTTGEIFESANLAAKHYSLDYSTICKCCRGQNKSCGVHKQTGERLRWSFYHGDYAKHNDNCDVAS